MKRKAQPIAEGAPRRLDERVAGLSSGDGLTEFLAGEIERHRREGKSLAYVAIRLRHITRVVAAFGLECHPSLLRAVARRLGHAMPAGASLFYVHSDVFGLVLPDAGYGATAAAVQAALIAFREPFVVGRLPIAIDAVIGVAEFPRHAADAASLRQAVASALYQAEHDAKAVAIYDAGRHRQQADLTVLLSELRQAIGSDQLELWYQPQVELDTGRCAAVEALVRWRHPSRGLIQPVEFIAGAEETHLIQDVATWVLRAGTGQLARWKAAGIDLRLSVNLSPRNLLYRELEDLVADLLGYYGIAPDRFELEVTESAVMMSPDRALRALAELKALGIGVAIDDFGAGHASLQYLADLPATTLKLDKGFIDNLGRGGRHEAIVGAIIALAHELGLRVVAEGVETEAACLCLKHLFCDAIQGYYAAVPMPLDRFEAWLATRPS